jgi:hypothetical protein
VGVLTGLAPPQLKIYAHEPRPGESGKPVNTSALDFRHAAGFKEAIRRAIAVLGFSAAANAEVKFVDNNEQFLAAIRANGKRQTLYFGHALGPGGLVPGGLSAVSIPPRDLASAFAKDAPRPIFVGCFGAEVPLDRRGGPQGAIGLDTAVKWTATEAGVTAQGMRRLDSLHANDVIIKTITLGAGETIDFRVRPQPLPPLSNPREVPR